MRTNPTKRKQEFIRTATWRTLSYLNPERVHSVSEIMNLVAIYFGVLPSNIKGYSEWWIDVAARHLTMALACRLLPHKSISQIAELCGKRDRTCVRAANKKYDDILDEMMLDTGWYYPARVDTKYRGPDLEKNRQRLQRAIRPDQYLLMLRRSDPKNEKKRNALALAAEIARNDSDPLLWALRAHHDRLDQYNELDGGEAPRGALSKGPGRQSTVSVETTWPTYHDEAA